MNNLEILYFLDKSNILKKHQSDLKLIDIKKNEGKENEKA